MITIYSKNNCPWCVKAKALLTEKQLIYKELNIDNGDYTKDDLRNLVGPDKALTVPQILFHGKLVGGYEDLLTYMEDHNIFGVQE